MLLDKTKILEVNDMKFEDVEVKEWGGSVRLRVMSGADRDVFEEMVFRSKGKVKDANMDNFRTKLLIMTIVDEAGNRIFDEKDIEALSKKSCLPMDRLCTVAMRLNGIGSKDVEDMVKNS